MFPSFELLWLFQSRCRLRLKWSEVVSTVEKAFGHFKLSRRWDLDIPRTSFVLPRIGFATSRVRKVTLKPTAAAVAVATRRRGAPLWRGGVLRRAGGSWPIGRRSSRPQRTKDHDLGAAQVRLPSLKGSDRERREIDTGVFRHQPRHRKPVKSSPSLRGSLHGARSRAGETPPKHWEPKGYSFSRRISRAYRHDTNTRKSVGRSPLACLRWSGVRRRRGGLWGWGFKYSHGQVRAW